MRYWGQQLHHTFGILLKVRQHHHRNQRQKTYIVRSYSVEGEYCHTIPGTHLMCLWQYIYFIYSSIPLPSSAVYECVEDCVTSIAQGLSVSSIWSFTGHFLLHYTEPSTHNNLAQKYCCFIRETFSTMCIAIIWAVVLTSFIIWKVPSYLNIEFHCSTNDVLQNSTRCKCANMWNRQNLEMLQNPSLYSD